MVERISLKIFNLITDGTNTQDDKSQVIIFGITRIIEDIPKATGIVLIGIILGILKEIGIVTMVVLLYKTFVGGLHLKTNISCFIYSLMFYLVTIYLSKYLLLTSNALIINQIIMFVFAIYVILKYVPADVIEIPKFNLNIRKILKKKAIISLAIIYTISFCIKSEETLRLILFSVFFINLMATKLMYKIFNVEYGYKKENDKIN